MRPLRERLKSKPRPRRVVARSLDARLHIQLLQAALKERPRDPGLLAQIVALKKRLKPKHLVQLENKARSAERTLPDLEARFQAGEIRVDDLLSALGSLGRMYLDLGRPCCAIPRFKRALNLAPASIELLDGLGRALYDGEKVPAAESVFRQLLQLSPDQPQAMARLAWCLRKRGKLNEMLDFGQRALEQDPTCVSALRAVAEVLFHRQEFAAARGMLERAAKLAPGDRNVRFQVGIHRLATGDYDGGWPEYEARFDVGPGELHEPDHPQPRWEGEELDGRTILVELEQGTGDVLQFLRFLPALQERGGKVLLPAPCHLYNLLRHADGIDLLIEPNAVGAVGFDVYAPLCSLGYLLGVQVEHLPYRSRYLRADPELSLRWKDRLARTGSGSWLKVGVVWAGTSAHPFDVSRSLDLEDLVPLAQAPGVELLSLQVGRQAPLAAARSLQLVDLAPELIDWAETAALIDNLDLVITVDTGVAHLTGAMGRPVWTLVAYDSDWRWLKARDDSPWYPSMRLFRQDAPMTWAPVIERVRKALLEFGRAAPVHAGHP
jgi:tetratricopeptide (TPR) repeat protein